MIDDLKKYFVFDNKLGCIKGIIVILKVKGDVLLKFFKFRFVLFVLWDKIVVELDRF